ncbi:MAG: hypothetical protein ACJAZO_004637 [Myxococcota bacterium]|jgi:hypothetical protein
MTLCGACGEVALVDGGQGRIRGLPFAIRGVQRMPSRHLLPARLSAVVAGLSLAERREEPLLYVALTNELSAMELYLKPGEVPSCVTAEGRWAWHNGRVQVGLAMYFDPTVVGHLRTFREAFRRIQGAEDAAEVETMCVEASAVMALVGKVVHAAAYLGTSDAEDLADGMVEQWLRRLNTRGVAAGELLQAHLKRRQLASTPPTPASPTVPPEPLVTGPSWTGTPTREELIAAAPEPKPFAPSACQVCGFPIGFDLRALNPVRCGVCRSVQVEQAPVGA